MHACNSFKKKYLVPDREHGGDVLLLRSLLPISNCQGILQITTCSNSKRDVGFLEW